MFTVLYPLGVTGEVLCMLAAIKEVRRTKFWCWEMPNMFNVIFYYDYYIIFTMILYVPGNFIFSLNGLFDNLILFTVFPILYFHMLGQRKKVLGPAGKKEN